jgi:hypothetical protein
MGLSSVFEMNANYLRSIRNSYAPLRARDFACGLRRPQNRLNFDSRAFTRATLRRTVGDGFAVIGNRSIKDRRHRVLRKNKTVLKLVILSAAGAYATVESKNPKSAGCDHAVTGSSSETALGKRLDAAIAEDTAPGSLCCARAYGVRKFFAGVKTHFEEAWTAWINPCPDTHSG